MFWFIDFCSWVCLIFFFFFFFNDTATTEIYTLSLHDALPISRKPSRARWPGRCACGCAAQDRKSTRLNSSHQLISYAVFCLKKKKKWQNGRAGLDKVLGGWMVYGLV